MTQSIQIKTTALSYRVGVTTTGYLTGTQLSLTDYLQPFIEYDYNPTTRSWVVTKKYRYYNKTTDEIYLPRYDLPRFTSLLDNNNIAWHESPMPVTLGKSVDIQLRAGVTARDELQQNAIAYLANDTSPVRGLAMQTGKGKAIALDTLVKIPGGWKPMGEIKLGDLVTAADGSATIVVGVYPQGLTQMYRVWFEDGRWIDTCFEHLWKIKVVSYFGLHHTVQLASTGQIYKLLKAQSKKIYIPTAIPELTPKITLIEDAYTLGVRLAKADLIKQMCDIPNWFTDANVEQRWDFLQGFIDTHIVELKRNRPIVLQINQFTFAAQIQTLLHSLGQIAAIKPICGTTTQDDIHYQIHTNLTQPLRIQHNRPYLQITAIKPVDAQLSQCIAVDHPSKLYVVKDYIVTHNTFSLLAGLAEIKRRAIILIPGMLEQWQSAINQFTILQPNDIYIVQGQHSVFKLMSQIDKTIFPKIILASISTLRNYCLDKLAFSNCPTFDRLCEIWDVGVRATDESHLNFHANLMMDLRLTPAVTIVITATFDNSKETVKKIFDSHYPLTIRYGETEYHRYVDVYAYSYITGTGDIPAFAYKGELGYSQIKWETWLLHRGKHKLRQITENVYLPLLRSHYDLVALPEEKCLILCETVDMCNYLLKECTYSFPNKKSAIYIGATEDDVLTTADIIISTSKSAGTGRDIKNLLTVFVTTSVRSTPLNEQMLGRLRVLQNRQPQFVYIYNLSIPSQISHATERANIFRPLAKTFHQLRL